jgi:hypothetical protein
MAISDSGGNIVKKFSDPELTLLGPARWAPLITVARPVGTLIGLTREQVTALLGSPSFSQGGLWNYDTQHGTLKIFLDKNKNDTVSTVGPDDFDLDWVRPPR